MKKIVLVISLLILAACNQVVITPTASPAPLRTAILAAATRPATNTATPEAVTVTISQAVVVVRQSPGGEATGKYVRSGERVQIIKCTGDWCRIKKPGGWIFRGCIQELADGLLCMAKP
jgi:hypothetical protein